MKRILIIEDDPAIIEGIKFSLEEEHFQIITACDGEIGLQIAKRENPDLIILDLVMPKKNGIEVCKELRDEGNNIPILMVTNKKDEIDKIMGLETGADDYLTKPFSVRELVARIKAVLRRSENVTREMQEFNFGDVFIDVKKHQVFKNNNFVNFSETEFKVFLFLVNHEGEVISRNKLLDEVWGYETYPTTRTVDNYILSIRKKIEDNPSEPKYILTIPKGGYRFVR